MIQLIREGSSFRDPSGFVFLRDGVPYRQVNASYQDDYGHLLSSGLYERLISEGLLVPHEEVELALAATDEAFRVLRPDRLPFVSYPYEWCFSQLKHAALTTLRIQSLALDHGMSLKDASAYNIQFRNGHPVLIDTLSFERFNEGAPWVPYRQFCQHFLAPLALMALRDVRLGQLLRIYVDGIPLDLAGGLLPARARVHPSLAIHLHMHARSQQRRRRTGQEKVGRVSERALRGLVDSLASGIKKLTWEPAGREWATYYSDAGSYSRAALDHKKEIVGAYLNRISPGTVWDLGANTGLFSRIAVESGAFTVSLDVDPSSVELNYRAAIDRGETRLLPLLQDLSNPSPGIGWENRERDSFVDRGPADALLALALVHHLAIGNNIPLERIAETLASWGSWLLVEFIPKSDPQVQEMLAYREDIFGAYREEGFRTAFETWFSIESRDPIKDSQRTLYLMRAR